jgi:hypothetical protein
MSSMIAKAKANRWTTCSPRPRLITLHPGSEPMGPRKALRMTPFHNFLITMSVVANRLGRALIAASIGTVAISGADRRCIRPGTLRIQDPGRILKSPAITNLRWRPRPNCLRGTGKAHRAWAKTSRSRARICRTYCVIMRCHFPACQHKQRWHSTGDLSPWQRASKHSRRRNIPSGV